MSFDVDRFAEELQDEIMRDVRKTYSKAVIQHWMYPINFTRMSDCDGYGRVTGSCGDTMEVFIKVYGEKIRNAAFFTDGCGTSIACGSMVVSLAKGESLDSAARIDKKTVLDALGGLPPEDQHCAELAANALRYALIDHETGRLKTERREE
jgi:nitrogen fixation NifU-like protein